MEVWAIVLIYIFVITLCTTLFSISFWIFVQTKGIIEEQNEKWAEAAYKNDDFRRCYNFARRVYGFAVERKNDDTHHDND